MAQQLNFEKQEGPRKGPKGSSESDLERKIQNLQTRIKNVKHTNIRKKKRNALPKICQKMSRK